MRVISGIFSLLILLFALQNFASADGTSTNYKIDSDFLPGGGEALIASTNYKIDASSIEGVSKPDMTSTNYGVGGSSSGAGPVPAEITSISPADFSRFYTDESTSYTVTAVSPEGASLDYQVKDGSTIKDGPQASNVLTWSLSGSDKGRHALYFQVIDSDTTISKPQSAYFFRRPIK